MDLIWQHLFEQSWLSLRDVLRLLLLSGLFTVACVLAFPRNAPTRRLLLLAAVSVLMVLPGLLSMFGPVWLVPWPNQPPVTLAAALPNFLCWLWLLVAAVLVAQHGRAVRRELRRLRGHPILTDQRAQNMLRELSQQLGLDAPELRLGDCACSTTLQNNLIVLPVGYADWSDLTLRSVLAHELVHIRRADDRWLLLTRLLVLAYWWMPWLISLYRVYLQVMEESCDDAASDLVGQEIGYLDALLDAVKTSPSGGLTYRSVAGMYQHHLVGRVGRFSDVRLLELNSRGLYWCVLGILLVVVGLTGLEPTPVRAKVLEPAADAYLFTEPVADDAVYPRVYRHVDVAGAANAGQRQRLAQPLQAPRVIYPGTAIRESIEGEVVISARVAADGSVVAARIKYSEPPGVFDQVALKAVRDMRYRPAPNSAMPQPQQLAIEQRFYFRLDAQ